MAKFRSILILLVIVACIIPVFFFIQYLQKKIAPRTSFLRLIIYMLIVCGLVYLSTFFIVFIIKNVFPLPA